MLRRRTDDGDSEGSEDTGGSLDEAVAAVAAAPAADRAWHTIKDIPFVEVDTFWRWRLGVRVSAHRQPCGGVRRVRQGLQGVRRALAHARRGVRARASRAQRARSARGSIRGVEWIGSDEQRQSKKKLMP